MRIPKQSMLPLAVLALVCGLVPVAHGALPTATYTTSAARGMWVRYDGVRDWFQFGLRYVEPWWSATDGTQTGIQCEDLPDVVTANISTISVTLYPSTGADDAPLDMEYRVIKIALSGVITEDDRGNAVVEGWPIQLSGPRTKKNIASARDWAFSDNFCGPNAQVGNTMLTRRSLKAGPACTKDYVTVLNTTGSVSIVVLGPKDFSKCDKNRTNADIIAVTYPRHGTMAAMDIMPTMGAPHVGSPLLVPLMAELLAWGLKSVAGAAAKKIFIDPIINAIFPPSKPDPLETWNAVKGYVQEYVTKAIDQAMFTKLNDDINGVYAVAKQFASLPDWNAQKQGHFIAMIGHFQSTTPEMMRTSGLQPGQMISYLVPFGDMYLESMALLVIDFQTVWGKPDTPGNAQANLKNLQDAINMYKTAAETAINKLTTDRTNAIWEGVEKSPRKPQTCSPSGGCGTYTWKDTSSGSYITIEYQNWDTGRNPNLAMLREENRERVLKAWAKLYKTRTMLNYRVNLAALTASSQLWQAKDPSKKFKIVEIEYMPSNPVSNWDWNEGTLNNVNNLPLDTTGRILERDSNDVSIYLYEGTASVPELGNKGVRGIQVANLDVPSTRLFAGTTTGPGLTEKSLRMYGHFKERIIKVEGVTGEAHLGIMYIKFTTSEGRTLEAGDSSLWKDISYYGSNDVSMTIVGGRMPNQYILSKFSYAFSAEAEQVVRLCEITTPKGWNSPYIDLGFSFCVPNPKVTPA